MLALSVMIVVIVQDEKINLGSNPDGWLNPKASAMDSAYKSATVT
ncbi:hypothetical protein SDC9_106272 [bioreactor metagenome]|uniref:Uncharacterized protein n=1 Tax=bioreactor metagenome TaxID=1076179 RepID=A0A645B1V7_9ZZZZ